MTTGSLFLLCIVGIHVGTVHMYVTDVEKLTEFEGMLDKAGLDLIHNMYDNYDNRMRREVPSESDVKQITDHSSRRVRRSVILDQVKAAQKTGNREELFLRSSLPHKKLLQIFDPADIVPIALTLDPPYNTMEKPTFFAVANYRNPLGSYDSAVIILRYNETNDDFTVHQFLNEYAPYELESFSGKVNPVTHKNFLSVSGFIDDQDPASFGNARVSIYEISPPPYFVFTKMQELRQHTVRAMKYIQIQQITYLILGMYYQVTRYGKQYSSPSQLLLLRFDVASNLFHFHSSLPGSGVTDIECFTVRGKTYLTVANYRDNIGRLGILSFIYVYNDQIRGFEMLQYLSTNGARDIEHFTLANEKYLVVANEATGTAANKSLNVDSDVYKLSNGRFELIQQLSTYGAVKWKSIAVPNCKQDVLLVYSDQRNDVDQVGIYTFSHDQEMFSTDHFSIYHLDFLNSTFRPNARALSAYSLQDQDTGEYSLYLIVGATDITEGNTIYKLTYEIILTDSPLDAFKRNVEIELENLKRSLEAVKSLLTKARSTLNDAVTTSGSQTITGTKTILGNIDARHADINNLNITKGGMLFVSGNETYTEDPSLSSGVSFSDIESSILKHNSSINKILEMRDEFMYVNVDQNVTSHMTFNQLGTAKVSVLGDLTVKSNYINDINLSDLTDIVMINEDVVITGKKTFTKSMFTRDVVVSGKVNGLSFSTDLVLQGKDDVIIAPKVFTKSVNATTNLLTDSVNGGDYLNKTLFVNRPGVVYGTNRFTSMVIAKDATFATINGWNMRDVMDNRVTKSTQQFITGLKTFEELTSNGDVDINGTINGVDLNALQMKLESQANISVLHGDKIFYDSITVTEDIIIENGINDKPFPENVLLKSSQAILAEKIFEGEVTLNNVEVAGEVDGMNMSDVVTLDSAQVIDGHKKFEWVTLKSDVYMRDNNTVNGIDISAFVKDVISTSDQENIAYLNFTDDIVISNAYIASINNETFSSLRDIWESCLHLHGDQNITAVIEVTNNVTVSKNLSASYINNFTFPGDFAALSGNQSFISNTSFRDDLVVTHLGVNGTVNDIDFDKFNEDIVTDQNRVVYGTKTIHGNVFVNGALSTEGKINGLNFTQDLMFYATDQNVTAKKCFDTMDFSGRDIKVVGDILVATTIDGVDLSDLELSGMTVSKNETITGSKCFSQTDYNRSIEYINGVDLSALRDDIVTLNTDQLITSKKVFNEVALQGNLNTTSTIDGIDVSELKQQMVLSDQNSSITGHVTFKQALSINGSLDANLINGIEMSNLRKDFISLSANLTLSNLTIVGNVTAANMDVKTINGVGTSDFVYRSKDQVISGDKQLGNVNVGDIIVNGTVNGVDLSSLRNEVVFKDADQAIVGKKIFLDDVNVRNINSSGFVNGIDLGNWDIVRSSSDTPQFINGKKSFTGHTDIDHLTIKGEINGRNLSLFNDAVLANGNYTLDNVIFKNGADVHGGISTNGNASVDGSINDVNLTEFDGEVLKRTGEQNLTSKIISGTTNADRIITGLVNGLNISEDLVTKATPQTIRGFKRFTSMKFEYVTAHKLVSGVNLTDFASNTLLKHATTTQVINGMKSFRNSSMDIVFCHGLVDGLNITVSSFVTLHTKQIIRGRKTLMGPGNFISNRCNVLGKVAGVDLISLNRSRVLLSRDQIITSEIEFEDDVTADKNVVISGLVNSVDVSEFNMSSPHLNETALGMIQTDLYNTLSNQCKSLTYVKNSLRASATQFDYFTERQKIHGDRIEHAEFFKIGNGSFLATSIYKNRVTHCTNSLIKRWNTTKMELYQAIPTSGAIKMVFFDTPWNASYLLVVNSKAGCVQGPSQLFRWNETSSMFHMVTPLPTSDAVDAVVHKEENYVVLFISNSNSTLSSWLLTPSSIVPYATLDDYPVSVHTFKINEVSHLAVSTRSEQSSSIGYVKIYKITKGNMTLVQLIATKGASSMTSFYVNGVDYLVIANDRAYSASGLSTYYLTVDVYRFSDGKFEWFNSIPTYRAYRVSTFRVGSFLYLAVTHFDDHVSFYLFGLEFGFQKAEKMNLAGIRGLTYIENEGKRYVFLASSPKVPSGASKLMELHPSGPDQRKVEKIISCY